MQNKQLFENSDLLEALDETGCDGIELWPFAFESGELDHVKEVVAAHTFEIAALCPYTDFTTSDETWQKSVEMAEDYLEYAEALDCKRIRTYTSKPRSAFTNSDDAKPIHWERAIKGLQTVADMAAEKGVLCYLEVTGSFGQLYDTSKTTIRILEEVRRDNVIVNLQPPLRGEDPYESARLLGPYVQHLHIHNWIGEFGYFTHLDSGDIDVSGFLDILRERGFDGYMSLEHAYSSKLSPDGKRDPVAVVRREIPYLKKLIAERE
jgi:sugar phosphate isomerase/epimerase